MCRRYQWGIPHQRCQARPIGPFLAQHIDVHRGAGAGDVDRLQQQGALQDDAMCMRRRDAVQKALDGVVLEQGVAGLGVVAQSRQDGRDDVLDVRGVIRWPAGTATWGR